MEAPAMYRVGNYVVDFDLRRVSSNGSAIDLGWRQFEALRLLVEAGGRVVDKETLLREIWQGQLVDESNLTKCIAQLRKSLGNGSGDEYVETVPRLGYRLAVPSVPVAHPVAETVPDRRSLRRWGLWAAGALLAVFGGVFAWSLFVSGARQAEADRAYEEGRRLRGQKNAAMLGAAIESFRKAIALNPRQSRYYSSLAEALTKVPISAEIDQKLMLETAEKAVALDARCGGCNAVLGFILFSRFWDWKRAEGPLRTAIELNPKDTGGRGYLAMLLATQGRLDEALRQVDLGIAADPYHASLHTIRASVLYFSRRYVEASEAAGRAVSFGQSQDAAWHWRAYAHLINGDAAGAISAFSSSGIDGYPRELEAVFRKEGLDGAARRVLADPDALKPNRRYRHAHWRMVLGDHAGALDELEGGWQARIFDVMYVAVDPMFEPLHNEPRFQRIVAGMNLPPPARGPR